MRGTFHMSALMRMIEKVSKTLLFIQLIWGMFLTPTPMMIAEQG
jgi:hypothetical protein